MHVSEERWGCRGTRADHSVATCILTVLNTVGSGIGLGLPLPQWCKKKLRQCQKSISLKSGNCASTLKNFSWICSCCIHSVKVQGATFVSEVCISCHTEVAATTPQ